MIDQIIPCTTETYAEYSAAYGDFARRVLAWALVDGAVVGLVESPFFGTSQLVRADEYQEDFMGYMSREAAEEEGYAT